MQITKANLNDLLGILVKDESAFEMIGTDHPKILADWVSFKNNPNCTCRGKVTKYFSDLFDKDPNVLNKYIKNEQIVEAELKRLLDARQLNNYVGRIFRVEKNEDAWKKFSESVNGKMFRSFSVLEKEDHVMVYFL